MSTFNKTFQPIIILILFIAILPPLVIFSVTEDSLKSEQENRNLKQKPIFNFDKLKDYPKQYEEYFSDQFGLRGWFTYLYNNMKYSLGDSPSDGVIIGKERWLFLNNGRYGNPIDHLLNIEMYNKRQLQSTAEHFQKVNSWLKERGIKYIFIIGPNKHTIYPEYLPDTIKRKSDKTSTDQLFSYLKQHTSLSFIDLRASLLSSKDTDVLYYKTGTHWNFYGANLAQFEIMKYLEQLYPEQLHPILYQHSDFKNIEAKDRALENMMRLKVQPILLAPYPEFGTNKANTYTYPASKRGEVHTALNNSKSLKLLVFRDSFFSSLEPFFNEQFQSSTYIWDKLNFEYLEKYIEINKPDIIIEEWVERTLPYVPKSNK